MLSVRFEGIPPRWIREFLRAYGFTWDRKTKCWIAEKSLERIAMAAQAEKFFQQYVSGTLLERP